MGSVEDQVVGPSTVRRYLGPQIADTLAPTGPVVLVRAALPGTTFEADGRRYPLHDGLHGVAQVRVRREPILVALVPKLKTVFRRHAE